MSIVRPSPEKPLQPGHNKTFHHSNERELFGQFFTEVNDQFEVEQNKIDFPLERSEPSEFMKFHCIRELSLRLGSRVLIQPLRLHR